MHKISVSLIILPVILSLTACGGKLSNPLKRKDKNTSQSIQSQEGVQIGSEGQDADTLDQTTAAEKDKAKKASGGSLLGTTVASLGDPSEQGFWLRTPLVKQETKGRIERIGGATVEVTLIPIEGDASAGSRISLAAMRALDLSLTDLPTLTVFKG